MPSFVPVAITQGVTYGLLSSLLSDLVLLATHPGQTSQILNPTRTFLSGVFGFLFFRVQIPNRSWEFIKEVHKNPGVFWKLSLDNYLFMCIYLSISNWSVTEVLVFVKDGAQPWILQRLFLTIPAHAVIIGILEGFGSHNWIRNQFQWEHLIQDPRR